MDIKANLYTIQHCSRYPDCTLRCNPDNNPHYLFDECFVGEPYNICIRTERFVQDSLSVKASIKPLNKYKICKRGEEIEYPMTDVMLNKIYVEACVCLLEEEKKLELTKVRLVELKSMLYDKTRNKYTFENIKQSEQKIKERYIKNGRILFDNNKIIEAQEEFNKCMNLKTVGYLDAEHNYNIIRCRIKQNDIRDDIFGLKWLSMEDVWVKVIMDELISKYIKDPEIYANIYKAFNNNPHGSLENYNKTQSEEDKITESQWADVIKFVRECKSDIRDKNDLFLENMRKTLNFADVLYDKGEYCEAINLYSKSLDYYGDLIHPVFIDENIDVLLIDLDRQVLLTYYGKAHSHAYLNEIKKLIELFEQMKKNKMLSDNMWALYILDNIFRKTNIILDKKFVRFIHQMYQGCPYHTMDDYNDAAQTNITKDEWAIVQKYISDNKINEDYLLSGEDEDEYSDFSV